MTDEIYNFIGNVPQNFRRGLSMTIKTLLALFLILYWLPLYNRNMLFGLGISWINWGTLFGILLLIDVFMTKRRLLG